MQSSVTITPSQLPNLLLTVAVHRPVQIWGPPGIGKSQLVEDFASSLGLDCVSLLGTQLAPEDLMGVPQIIDDGVGPARSRFCPPELIARSIPYVLFLDELNGASPDVQKAFYSLILNGRIGSYELPKGSVVIAAGNRSTDNAIVRQMSSALVNRMFHVHLHASSSDWLAWAESNNIHPLVLDYIRHRPDHLSVLPPKTEEAFSTPRSWHILSDILHSAGEKITDEDLRVFSYGCVTPAHAASFLAFAKSVKRSVDLDAVLKNEKALPKSVKDRDILYFLASSLQARLNRSLPEKKDGLSSSQKELAHNAKRIVSELAEVSLEIAQQVITPEEDGTLVLPEWFLLEIVRDLPRLASRKK